MRSPFLKKIITSDQENLSNSNSSADVAKKNEKATGSENI